VNRALPLDLLSDLLKADSLESWFSVAAQILVDNVRSERVVLAFRAQDGRYIPQPIEWHSSAQTAAPAAILRPLLRSLFSTGGEETVSLNAVCKALGHFKMISATLKVVGAGDLVAAIFDAEESTQEDLTELLSLLGGFYSRIAKAEVVTTAPAIAGRYERLVEHSDAILFNTNSDHQVQFISRRALDFFGLAPEEFNTAGRLRWIDLLFPEDAAKLRLNLNRQRSNPHPFDEEVRVINRVTGRLRWILVRLVPLISEAGQLLGWDGFGIDISSRKEAQSALDVQSKKIRALYTVASAIRGYLDPSNIAIRGLAALCDATGAHAGICYLYQGESLRGRPGFGAIESDLRDDRPLESIARYGLPRELDSGVLTALEALAAHVAQSNQSLVVPDLGSDPRSGMGLVTQELLRSAVLVPVAVEDEVLGVVGLFSSELSRFDGSSVMLVGAAANQIGLAARQANLFALYRKQTKYLSALYRMSHELSRHLQPEPLYQNAFSIIRDELGLKRLWLGLLNDAQTRLIGQAAYGPGWRRRLIDVSVDILRSDHALGRVVATKRPLVIENSEELLKEFGVKKLFSRMSISAVALVPIIAGDQILGVLAVQPGVNEPNFQRDQLHLLTSLASEIGVSIQTQNLSTRMREAEKMRASSMLAAGIAHNFNNSLQAIMGQASLLEMQSNNPERVKKAALVINEAATKSAGLVRQLLSFTQLEEPRCESLDVRDYLTRSQELFQRLVTAKTRMHFEFSENLPAIYFDPNHLARVFNSLLQNATEAMPSGGEIFFRVEPIELGEERTVLEVPPGRYVRVTLRDTGHGMSEDEVRRCFEPFFTTKNVDPGSGLGLSGSGLGLSTAYTLVRRNGGRILVESQSGVGTVFTLYFPVVSSQLVVEKVRTEERSLTPTGTKRAEVRDGTRL